METAKKILVVEDEGLIAKEIQSRLIKLGYDVPLTVNSGEEAVRQAEKITPDLVLMDIVLKGEMDGIQAAAQIIKKRDIPVIYLTAYGDDQTLTRAKETGPFGYILKPFVEHDLRVSVEIGLYKHGMEKKLREQKEALRKSEARFRHFLYDLRDITYEVDDSGSVTYANKMAETVIGLSLDTIIGIPFLELFTKESQRLVLKFYDESAHSENEQYDLTFTNGKICSFKNEIKKDEKGHTIGLFGTARDITRQKSIEKKLDRYREHLEVLVDKRSRELSETQSELLYKDRLATMGQLTAIAGYEMRLPLEALKTSLPFLREGLNVKDVKIKNILELFESKIIWCEEIIEDVLSYTNNTAFDPEPTLIDEWLETLLDTPLLNEESCIRTNLNSGATVTIDRGRLSRCITTIINKAKEAVLIKGDAIETIEEHLLIETCVADDRLKICITDDGLGIFPDEFDGTFEPFSDTRRSGLGLWLFIIKHSMEEHYGGIDIKTREGKGTTANLWLPIWQ